MRILLACFVGLCLGFVLLALILAGDDGHER